MSGICGLVDVNATLGIEQKKGIIRDMSRALTSIGACDEYDYVDQRCALACRRRMANGLESPATSAEAGDRGIRCVLNGPVYGCSGLPGGDSISSVDMTMDAFVGKLYQKYGVSFASHLDGEFSLALWDASAQTLLLAKDRFGSMPLFYYHNGQMAVFASEIKSLLASRLVPVETNVPAVNDFMSFGYVPHPETMFKDIVQVGPGTVVSINRERVTKHQYWMFEFKDGKEHKEEHYISCFLEGLTRAVKKRLVADRPMAAYLSGGLDSSGICAILAKFTDATFKAITVGFHEPQFSEVPFANMVADHLGLDWVCRVMEPEDIATLFEKTVSLYDSPFEDTSAFPSYYGAKIAAQYAGVVLTGDGPDQLMAGSERHVNLQSAIQADNWYLKMLRKSGLKHIFRTLPIMTQNDGFINTLKRRAYNGSLDFAERIYEPRGATLLLKRFLYTPELLRINQAYAPTRNIMPTLKHAQGRHPIEQTLYFDMYYYMHDNLNIKVERTCSAHGLECRRPYLDRELLGLYETIPLHYRLNGLESKYLLKKAFAGLVPNQVIYKTKQGFGIPRNEWFTGKYKEYIMDLLLSQSCLQRGYFRKNAIRHLVNSYFEPEHSRILSSDRLIISLLSLELWHRLYIDQSANSRGH